MDIFANYVVYDDELAVEIEDDIEPRLPADIQSDVWNLDTDLDEWNLFDKNSFTVEIASTVEKVG